MAFRLVQPGVCSFKRLLVAVVHRATHDLQMTSAEPDTDVQSLRMEAVRWVLEDSSEQFSFEWFIENSDLESLKEKIKRMARAVKINEKIGKENEENN